jgi:type VI secretion system protein ImpL
MKRVLAGSLIFVVYLACVVAAAFALHFSGSKFVFFCIVLGLLGGATIAFAVWYMSRMGSEPAGSEGSDSINLEALLRDAERKLRTSRLGVKSLAAVQIIYIVGEDNSAKTQTVLQSGLDAELLAGNLFRDGVVAPTQLANIWLAGSSVIVEAGGALLRQPALWQRLIKATRPGKLGSVFAKDSRQPPRAVVVCVSAERVPGPSEAGYDVNQIRSSAQTLNERLRQLSQTLGISVPVYVLFTKLDTLAHFADYVGRLSAEEVKVPLGSLLAQVEAGSGLFAERASTLVSSRMDELIYALSEFRLEVLSRGGELKMLASAYEFPRDLQKRRGTVVDFLVELTRPSQLGINPFLRGFFFSGMRAVLVEEVVAGPAQPQPSSHIDAGATRVFSIGGDQAKQSQQLPVRSGLRKDPQWAFLPHLFSKLLLSDKSALEVSRASTKVNLLKRVLLAGVCCCIFAFLVVLTISFVNNRDLDQRVSAAAAIQVSPASPTKLASTQDMKNLDELGTLLRQLDSNRRNGAPLMYRWGLYRGEPLYQTACKAYSAKFYALLLSPTQLNILTQLRALVSPPAPGAEYNAPYDSLKAYLITTSNPEKSTVDFLPPVLTAAWVGGSSPPSELVGLAQIQFQTYASLLAEPQSCIGSVGGQPDRATVYHVRDYLSRFGGSQHIYQNMLAKANSKNPSVHFNDNPNYPNSAHYVIDSYQVPGAFTKPGFAFMDNAIQHPETYYNGDEWVLGSKVGPSVDEATLSSQIQKLYVADYVNQWRAYLNAAHFVGFQNWKDAADKLSALNSNTSAILGLFSLISINTNVAQPDIVKAFQAPQSVVPPSSLDNGLIAPSNQPYITALLALEQAVRALIQNPLSVNDPAAAIPVQQAANVADQAVKSMRIVFKADPDGKMDMVSVTRLEDPINSISKLVANQINEGPNKEGAAFCMQANNVLGKFPFSRKATIEATPDEVAALFSPAQGALAQFTRKQSQLIFFQNGQWIANPATALSVNPKFLNFLTAAQKVTAALFTAGGNQPTLSFSLKESKTVPDAVLTIDDQQVSAGQTTQFHWISSPESKIIFMTAQKPNTIATGAWSVFHLGLDASHPGPNTILPSVLSNGRSTETVPFEIGGSGALLLDPRFMDQLRCNPTVVP